MRAVLCTMAISDVRERLAQQQRHYFDDEEAAALQGAPVQTWAGRMALKEALARLWQCWKVPCRPRDFRMARAWNGAPRVVGEVPGDPRLLAGVRVSITHSRDTACGLAVGPEGPR